MRINKTKSFPKELRQEGAWGYKVGLGARSLRLVSDALLQISEFQSLNIAWRCGSSLSLPQEPNSNLRIHTMWNKELGWSKRQQRGAPVRGQGC